MDLQLHRRGAGLRGRGAGLARPRTSSTRHRSSPSTTRSRGGGGGRRSWRPDAGSASTGRPSTAAAARRRCRSRSSTWSTHALARAAAREPGRHQPRRSDAARPRHRGAEAAMAARRSSTPSEIWCQLFSEPGAGSRPRVARRRAPSRSTAAGCSAGQKVWTSYASTPGGGSASRARTPTRRSTGASRTSSSTWRPPGIEIRPLRPDHRRGRVQRGVPRRGVRARRPPRRRARPGLGGRQHDARPRAGHRRSRSRSRSCTRCTSTSCTRSRPSGGALDDPEVADALAQAFVELRVLRLHNWRTLSRLARGESSRARSRAG